MKSNRPYFKILGKKTGIYLRVNDSDLLCNRPLFDDFMTCRMSEIIDIAYRLVAAKDEILIIFHTSNALVRQEKAGGLDLLIENVLNCKTQVKILIPIEDKITSIIHRLQQIDGIHIDLYPIYETLNQQFRQR